MSPGHHEHDDQTRAAARGRSTRSPDIITPCRADVVSSMHSPASETPIAVVLWAETIRRHHHLCKYTRKKKHVAEETR